MGYIPSVMTEEAPRDVVVIAGPTADDAGARVIRLKDDVVSVGEVRPMKDGAPIMQGAEVVRLAPREGTPRVCDVEVLYEAPARASKGPPKVANDKYRDNWERVFGAPRVQGETPS